MKEDELFAQLPTIESAETMEHISRQLLSVIGENGRDGAESHQLFKASLHFFTTIIIGFEVDLEESIKYLKYSHHILEAQLKNEPKQIE